MCVPGSKGNTYNIFLVQGQLRSNNCTGGGGGGGGGGGERGLGLHYLRKGYGNIFLFLAKQNEQVN